MNSSEPDPESKRSMWRKIRLLDISISLSVLHGIVAQFRADLDRHFKPYTQPA